MGLTVTVLAVAHRGDPYHFRENTLPSVRSALLKGADVVEVDVRITRDGVPVLLHDPTLDRLWGVGTEVGALTAAEITLLTGGRVPTLGAALAELRAHAAGRMLLDLTEAGQVGPSLAAVRQAGVADRILYCGDLAAMLEVRAYDPAAEIAMTWKTSRRPPPALVAGLAPRWLNLRFPLADRGTVAWAHDHGLLAAAWTPDWRRSMSRLIAHGIDAITTNRLDALQRTLTHYA